MTSDNVPGRPPGRSLRIALMVSLALNVLIIGGVVSAMLVARHQWRSHGEGAFGLLGFARTLPQDRGDIIRKTIADKEPALVPLRQAESEARHSARSALMAQPFDAARFKAALESAVVADAQEKRARMDILAATAAALTPEERLELHQWFEARRRIRHHQRDDDAKAEPPPSQPKVVPASAE